MQKKDFPSHKKFFSIGELSTYFDITPSTLRYWEKEFKGLKPNKSPGGTRFYSRDDFELLTKIHNLVKIKKHQVAAAVRLIENGENIIDENFAMVEKLEKLRDFLIQLKEKL